MKKRKTKRNRKQERELLKALGEEQPKPHKYRARKVKWFGHTFDSKKEGDYYLACRLRRQRGEIRNLELQPRITIVIGGVPVRYPNGKQMVYTADFRYFDVELQETITIDVKSEATRKERGYRMTRALLYTMGVEVEEV